MKIFNDEIHEYQTFIRQNFNLLGNQYEIIKEQCIINSGIIDILAYNKERQCLAIIELKNIKIDSKVNIQVLKYYLELQNKYVFNYEILNPPEIFIIAPEFDSNFTVTSDMPPITLLQITLDNNNIICNRIIPKIKDINKNNIINQEIIIKNKKSVNINLNQKILTKNIIKILKAIFIKKHALEEFKILESDDHIDILCPKIIAKIKYPRQWFADHIQLCLYKKYFNINLNLNYDPNIKKIYQLKNMIKLDIINIPYFLYDL